MSAYGKTSMPNSFFFDIKEAKGLYPHLKFLRIIRLKEYLFLGVCNRLILLAYMARPEGFEPPTYGFVVQIKTFVYLCVK